MKRFLLFLALPFALCCSKTGENDQPKPDPAPDDGLTVYTLASYNVKCDDGASGDKSWSGCRKELVPALILQRDFDVCGFCEVSQPSIREDLKESLGDVYTLNFYGRDSKIESGEAVGFGFKKDKFTLVNSGYFYLNTHPDTPGEAVEWMSPDREEPFGRSRVAAWALLEDKTEGTRFYFMVSHFELNEGMREGSAKLIIEKAQSMAADGTPVFFCGDLNAQPDEKNCIGKLSDYFTDSYTFALQNGLECEGKLTTYNKFDQYISKASGKRIDYMFYRGKNVVLKKYGVIYDLVNDKLPSDHYPIYVQVSFKQ